MGYKYLNTYYPELFDSASLNNLTISNGFIVNSNSSTKYILTKNIYPKISTTSIYIKMTVATNSVSDQNRCVMHINLLNNTNYLKLSTNSSQLVLTDNNGSFSWVGNVPSRPLRVDVTLASLYQRDLLIHFDTVMNCVDIYSDGIFYASIDCAYNGEYIDKISLGGVEAGTSKTYYAAIKNIIISDTEFSPLESVTEITPTLTSNDWTITDGVASTDTLGDSMTITAPSSSIDETRKTVTGYAIPLLNCIPTTTINSLNITQGTVTKNVKLPLDGSTESDNFTVSQLADISATAIASYTS
jgi:hypothetical protein